MKFPRTSYQFLILFLLIEFSMQTCTVQNMDTLICNRYNTDGTCMFEWQNRSLSVCTNLVFTDLDIKAAKVDFLSISPKSLSTLVPGAFDNFKNIYSIDLNKNSVKEIPLGVFNTLTTLRILDLSENQLEDAQKGALNGLKRLGELRVSRNKIHDVTPFLDSCKSLQILDISFNRIKTLQFPKSCKKLLYLYASHNEITQLSDDLFIHMKLVFLDVSYNLITYVKRETFMYLNQTKTLNISRNKLFENDEMHVDIFRYLTHLQYLNLSHTSLKNIPFGAFSPLSKLEVLDLSKNYIDQIQKDVFHDLFSLKKIYLNENKITKLYFLTNPNIEEISFKDNDLTCDNLISLWRAYKNANIIGSTAYESSNVYGIKCNPSAQVTNAPFDVEDERREYLARIQQDVKQVAKELASDSNTFTNIQKALFEIKATLKSSENLLRLLVGPDKLKEMKQRRRGFAVKKSKSRH